MSPIHDKAMLEVKNLSKNFGSFQAVKSLNIQVQKGEIFGFLGPNGAGKTTTMRIITCFIPPSTGTVHVDGIDTTVNPLEVRRKIGYLPENNPLYNDMTVKEYLSFVGDIRGIKGKLLASRIDEMFSICALTRMATRQIGKLSKGYRQRVGLAQAMIHNPELLILDEPMSGLDPNQIVEIRHLIKKMGKEKTVIYCSHILSEVSATCDRILIINEGNVVATGSSDELTAMSTKGNRYLIKIKGDRTAIQNGLLTAPGVLSVGIKGEDNGWHTAEVVAKQADDIGESIFSCAVTNGWSLAELRHESASLEDVFTQLTRG